LRYPPACAPHTDRRKFFKRFLERGLPQPKVKINHKEHKEHKKFTKNTEKKLCDLCAYFVRFVVKRLE